MLEGAARSDASPIRAPLPPKTAEIAGDLMDDRFGDLPELQKALQGDRDTATEVTGGMRTGHLTLAAMLRSMSLFFMIFFGGFLSFWIAFGSTVTSDRFDPERMIGWLETEESRSAILKVAEAQRVERKKAHEKLEKLLAPENLDDTRAKLREGGAKQQQLNSRFTDRLNRLEAWALNGMVEMIGRQKGFEMTPDLDQKGKLILSGVALGEREKSTVDDELINLKPALLVSLLLVLSPPLIFGPVRALIFRGGLSFWMAGITVVRWNGRPAGRMRCALRDLLHWFPFTAFLTASLVLQCLSPEMVALRTFFFALSLATLVGMIVFGLRDPERTPVDKLLGTYLVPS